MKYFIFAQRVKPVTEYSMTVPTYQQVLERLAQKGELKPLNLNERLMDLYKSLPATLNEENRKVGAFKLVMRPTLKLDITTGVIEDCTDLDSYKVEGSLVAFMTKRELMSSMEVVKVTGLDSNLFWEAPWKGADFLRFNEPKARLAIMTAFYQNRDWVCPTHVAIEVDDTKEQTVEGHVVVTTDARLIKDGFALEHKSRLRAMAMIGADGEPAVAMDVQIDLWKSVSADLESLEDGISHIMWSHFDGIFPGLLPEGLIGDVPVTIRLLGWEYNRLGKSNLIVMSDDEFKENYKNHFNKEWTAGCAKMIAPLKTVKNAAKQSETIVVDVLVHKINILGGITRQGVDFKEILENVYANGVLEKIIKMIEHKAEKNAKIVSRKATFLEWIRKLSAEDIMKMAKDASGETNMAKAKKVTSIKEVIKQGFDSSIFPRSELIMMISKLLEQTSSISEEGIRMANRSHDGKVVDGKKYWIAMPKTTKQLVDGVLTTIDLYTPTMKKGWIKVKRSPVTRGCYTIPADKILWLEERQTILVCLAITKMANSDQDGDCFTMTWENPTIIYKDLDILWAVSKEYDAFHDEKRKLLSVTDKSNLYSEVRVQAAAAGLTGAWKDFLISSVANDSIGIFSNVALDYFEKYEGMVTSDIENLLKFRSLVDLCNEGIVKSFKHIDTAQFPVEDVLRSTIGVVLAKGKKTPNNILRKNPLAAIGKDLECSTTTVLKPLAKHFKTINIDWLDESVLFAEKLVVVNAIEKVMSFLTKMLPDFINQKAMVDVLANKPGIKYNHVQLKLGWRHYGEEVHNAMFAVLTKNGDQSKNVNVLRAYDIANPTRYPLACVAILARLYNATRPNSRVAMFNSGRAIAQEWAVVAEWVRLNTKVDPTDPNGPNGGKPVESSFVENTQVASVIELDLNTKPVVKSKKRSWSPLARARARERFWMVLDQQANAIYQQNSDASEVLADLASYVDSNLFGNRLNSPIIRRCLENKLKAMYHVVAA